MAGISDHFAALHCAPHGTAENDDRCAYQVVMPNP